MIQSYKKNLLGKESNRILLKFICCCSATIGEQSSACCPRVPQVDD